MGRRKAEISLSDFLVYAQDLRQLILATRLGPMRHRTPTYRKGSSNPSVGPEHEATDLTTGFMCFCAYSLRLRRNDVAPAGPCHPHYHVLAYCRQGVHTRSGTTSGSELF